MRPLRAAKGSRLAAEPVSSGSYMCDAVQTSCVCAKAENSAGVNTLVLVVPDGDVAARLCFRGVLPSRPLAKG